MAQIAELTFPCSLFCVRVGCIPVFPATRGSDGETVSSLRSAAGMFLRSVFDRQLGFLELSCVVPGFRASLKVVISPQGVDMALPFLDLWFNLFH